MSLEWFVSQAPYLIHYGSIAPHITGIGIFLEMQSLYIAYNRVHSTCISYRTNSITIAYHTSGAVHLTGIIPPLDM